MKTLGFSGFMRQNHVCSRTRAGCCSALVAQLT